ncbi:MAG: hypothetical protein GC154_05470 [bacterium]|nr:hypothetical protein [bacterium]
MGTLSRRNFIGAVSAAALSRTVRAADAKTLNAGLIGCGWYGNVDIRSAFASGGVKVAAICDVDTEHLKQTADAVEKEQNSRPKTFSDYQELLDSPDLDFIIIATPPHWHALPFIAACEKGFPIYCEKPLAYDVREGRAMANAHKKAGNIVQIGFQRRQSQAFAEAKKRIESGACGEVIQADANIHYKAGLKDTTVQESPKTLDWDQWCGPAPLLPYCPNIGHFNWRLEKTTGHGHLVDWGIHYIDAIRMTLGLGMPTSVFASGGLFHPDYVDKITTPDTLTVDFHFGRLPVTWRHRIWGSAEYTPSTNIGVTFLCEKETLFVNDNSVEIIPNVKDAERTVLKPEQGNLGEAHMAEFLAAVREGKPAPCSPEIAFQSTGTVQLGTIAYETRERVDWDAEKESITSGEAAHALLKREYRAGYEHPYKA